MCGIHGIVRLASGAPPIDRDELLATGRALRSRGPDGEGEWFSPDGFAAFGHRRLAILDLSPAAAQPMARRDGRFQIVYNGEIYNFRALRRELAAAGEELFTESDTEVLLALYARHGTAMLSRLRGMYALALWDQQRHSLLLARDPYGIKPLYYSHSGEGTLRFASQVTALLAGGAIAPDPDPVAIGSFLLWGSVAEPRTVRRAIKALPAGHHLEIEDGRLGEPVSHTPILRLGPRQASHALLADPIAADPIAADPIAADPIAADPTAADPTAIAVAAVEDSIRAHLVSDVPVAVFLSAGLDSTLIAALASRTLSEPPVSLTLRFDHYRDTPMDEGPLAAQVAATLGTHHIERTVGATDLTDLWHSALAAMDQPSIDGFNTFLISHLAAEEGIKVVLSGLGGDEIFGSYPSFANVPRWMRWASRARWLPGARALWPTLAHRIAPQTPKLASLLRHGGSLAGSYLLRRGLFLPSELPALLGEEVASEVLASYDPVRDIARSLATDLFDTGGTGRPLDPWIAVHAMESAGYLRHQLLRDADWASMAHGLEIRVPLVDSWLRAQLAAVNFEPARSQGKAALVRRAAPELPEALWRRPKSGFSIPLLEGLEQVEGTTEDSPHAAATAATAATPGGRSRQLALRVLGELGLDEVLRR